MRFFLLLLLFPLVFHSDTFATVLFCVVACLVVPPARRRRRRRREPFSRQPPTHRPSQRPVSNYNLIISGGG